MAKSDGEIIVEIKLEQDEFDRRISQLENETASLGKHVAQSGQGFTILKGTMANLVSQGIAKVSAGFKKLSGDMVQNAAAVKAQNAQYEQTFGTMEAAATKAIHNVASESGILDTRLKQTGTQLFAFAKTTGMEAPQALELMERGLKVTADQAAYYDKSLEEVSESLRSFLKGNYANDAALGLSCTEVTRNTAANKLYGKSFMELSEAQKQMTLLQMVEDANRLSGALGQAARESDGWENVLGNLKETYRQFSAELGEPVLENLIPIVQDVVKEFKEWSASVDWDSYSAAVKKFFDVVKTGAGVVISAFPTIIKYTKQAIPLVVALASAYAGMKSAQAIKNVLGPTKQFFTLLKNGNKLINTFAIMTANCGGELLDFGSSIIAAGGGLKGLSSVLMGFVGGPVGMAITAIGMLAAGTLTWAHSLKDSSAAGMETKTITEELAEKTQELNEKMNESSEAFKTQVEASEVNARTAEMLTQKIDELAQKENKSASEKAKLKAMVDELNTVMPELNLQYDAETDKLNMSTDAIYKKIDAMKEEAKQAAYVAQYKKAVEAQVEAEIALGTAQQEHATNAQRIAEIEGQLGNTIQKGTVEYSNAQVEIGKLKNENQSLEESMGSLADTYDEASQRVQVAGDMMEENLVPASEEIKAKFEELKATCEQSGIEIPQSVANGIMEGQYVLPTTVEGMNALIQFDSMVQKAQAAGIQIPADLAAGVANGTISIETAIATLNQLINDGLAPADGSLAPKGAAKVQEYASGISSNQGAVTSSAQTVNNALTTELGNTAQTTPAGTKQMQAYSQGINTGESQVKTAAQTVVTGVITEFDSHVGEAETAGQNISNGLASGIQSMAESVAAAAAEVASAAIAAAEAALDEHSPSKVFRKIGVFAWMGFNEGQESQTKSVAKYSSDNANTAIKSAAHKLRMAEMGDLRYKSNFRNSAYVSSTPMGTGKSYQVNQTFNGTGTPDPVTAAREAKNMINRLEWQK